MKRSAFLLVATIIVAGPALAEDPAPAPTTAPAAQGDASSDTSYLDKVVCKTLPPPTGTLLGARKICQTERQWRQLQNDSQKDITDHQQKLGGYGGPSG